MSRYLKAAGIALLALLSVVPVTSAQRRVVAGGGIRFVGAAWYDPFWGPFWGWGYSYPVYAGPSVANTGEVKIKAARDALVYVNDGYAGTAGKLKEFSLPVGAHTIELRDPSGHAYHQERVTVIRGKTVKVDASAAH